MDLTKNIQLLTPYSGKKAHKSYLQKRRRLLLKQISSKTKNSKFKHASKQVVTKNSYKQLFYVPRHHPNNYSKLRAQRTHAEIGPHTWLPPNSHVVFNFTYSP